MLLRVEDISKQFYGNTVLSDISLDFSKGEVHAIVGENGAGKSTLIKIIGGNYRADSGYISIDEQPVDIQSQYQAGNLGIHIVYQEYNLVPHMTVLDNILLGSEPVGKYGLIRTGEAQKRIEKLADEYGIRVDLGKYAGDLSSAEAKLTEILRACSHDMRILILDEPTAALDDDDVHALFELLDAFRRGGIGVIYISHRLDEVFRLCDKATVLKDGKHIGTWLTKDINHDFLITSMVGRELHDIFPGRRKLTQESVKEKQTEIVLETENLIDNEHFYDISFQLAKGEILGIGGMKGHGQRELLRSLFGIHHITQGSIRVDRNVVTVKHPKDAVALGIAFLSDDRKNEGLALTQPIARNISYPSMKQRTKFGVLQKEKDKQVVIDVVRRLKIKLNYIYQTVQGLSGGNQQRVVLAKWLPLNPRVLLFHEPTLGIDVGAKAEIYALLREFTAHGIAILMVTSDMLELINMTDRIMVLYEGRIQSVLNSAAATEEMVMAAASGR